MIIQHPDKDYGFVVHEVLGSGTFGQVASVTRTDNKRQMAMKIIKSKKAFFQFVNTYEIKILKLLNKYENKLAANFVKSTDAPSSRKIKGTELFEEEGEYDKKIICMNDCFEHATHMVLMFEKLDISL